MTLLSSCFDPTPIPRIGLGLLDYCFYFPLAKMLERNLTCHFVAAPNREPQKQEYEEDLDQSFEYRESANETDCLEELPT